MMWRVEIAAYLQCDEKRNTTREKDVLQNQVICEFAVYTQMPLNVQIERGL